jgi:hypothetical protein
LGMNQEIEDWDNDWGSRGLVSHLPITQITTKDNFWTI